MRPRREPSRDWSPLDNPLYCTKPDGRDTVPKILWGARSARGAEAFLRSSLDPDGCLVRIPDSAPCRSPKPRPPSEVLTPRGNGGQTQLDARDRLHSREDTPICPPISPRSHPREPGAPAPARCANALGLSPPFPPNRSAPLDRTPVALGPLERSTCPCLPGNHRSLASGGVPTILGLEVSSPPGWTASRSRARETHPSHGHHVYASSDYRTLFSSAP